MLRFKVPQKKMEEGLLAMRRLRRQTDVWIMTVSESPEQDLKQLLYYDRLGSTDLSRVSGLKRGIVPVLVRTGVEPGPDVRNAFLEQVMELPVKAGLLFGTSQDKIEVFYVLKDEEKVTGPAVLSVVGPRMEKIRLLSLDGNDRSNGEAEGIKATSGAVGDGSITGSGEEFRRGYDRLAGAIGLGDIERGFGLLAKAAGLVVVVVGVGRAGSWLAVRLAQSMVGTDGALILVDPDVIEVWNLDGMFVAHAAVGMPKVLGVGGTIKGLVGDGRVRCVCASLGDEEVLDILRTADVVFTTVDEPSARVAAAVIASRFHIVHIDARGGLAWNGRHEAVEGGDFEGFLPGSGHGCIGCHEEYDWDEVIRMAGLSGDAERKRRSSLKWPKQKPGSNVDILMPVLGEACQAFWNIMRGRITESFWWHYEKDATGGPVWDKMSEGGAFGRRGGCRICREQSGLGDILD